MRRQPIHTETAALVAYVEAAHRWRQLRWIQLIIGLVALGTSIWGFISWARLAAAFDGMVESTKALADLAGQDVNGEFGPPLVMMSLSMATRATTSIVMGFFGVHQIVTAAMNWNLKPGGRALLALVHRELERTSESPAGSSDAAG